MKISDLNRDKVVVISIIISVFLFLIITKTLFSGYHFVDDHEVIKIKNDLKSSSLIEVTKNWVNEDLKSNARFRPIYYVHRVFATKVLGSDFLLWSLYTAILCSLALISFYLGMRNLKFDIIQSLTFLLITFIGPQSSIWWRLGPAESLGMVFLGFSFYFMTKSFFKKNYRLNNFLFTLFMILASMTKESFLVLIPAMIVFKIWNEKILLFRTLKESIKKNLFLLVLLLILFLELYIIKYYVGTIYSVLDMKFSDLIKTIGSCCLNLFRTYLNVAFVFLMVFVMILFYGKIKIRENLPAFVFFILIAAPNIILYSRTGLMERYLLPTSFGLGFLIVSFIKVIDEKPSWVKKSGIVILILSFIPFVVSTIKEASDFSREGFETKELFSAISESANDGGQVLVIVDPVESYEYSVSLKTYLYYENNVDLFGYAVVKDDNSTYYQEYVQGWKSYFKDKQFEDLNSKPELLIFLDNQLIDKFFAEGKLIQSCYIPINIGKSRFAVLKEKS